MELFRLLGTIAIDNSNANSEISETVGNAEQSQSRITAAFKKIGTAVATYFAAEKIAAFGKICLDAAANVQAMSSQFSQVFGGFENEAAEHLSSIADDAGIVENRLKGSYTQIAAFAKTTGMETEEALALADRALVAVADSAAFYDRSLEDVTESLQSFLKGNYENDAALGLSCTEVTRNAAANELYGKSFQDLSEAQKQLTLLKMVEDANALSGALGQAARESETWSNQTGNLKQAWTDFTAMIGTGFLPIAIKVVTALQKIVTWMTEHKSVVTAVSIGVGTLTTAIIAYNVAQTSSISIMALATAAGTAFGSVMAFLTSPITLVVAAIGALVAAGVLLYQNWDTVKEKAIEFGEKVNQVWSNVSNWIGTAISKIGQHCSLLGGYLSGMWSSIQATVENVKNIFNGLIDFVSNVFAGNWSAAWKNVVNIFANLFGGLANIAKAPINAVIGMINSVLDRINNISIDIPDWMGGGTFGVNIPKIPLLANGGVLEKGQVGLLEGTGAEAVVPLENNKKWISAVAEDMERSVGDGEAITVLNHILDAIREMDDKFESKITDLMMAMRIEINGRELGRIIDSELGRFNYAKVRGR